MEIMNEQQPATPLQVTEPKHFRIGKIVLFSVINGIMGGVFGIIVSFGTLAILDGFPIAGCIYLAIIFITLFFFPILAGGNPYIVHLVRKIPQQPPWNEKSFVVQMALSPRLHTGIRGFLEDADDIGFLTFTTDTIIFYGDQTTLRLPKDSLTEVSTRNVGWRGLWICGYYTRLRSNLLSDHEFVEFADRSTWTVISAFRRSEELFKELQPDLNKYNRNIIPDAAECPG